MCNKLFTLFIKNHICPPCAVYMNHSFGRLMGYDPMTFRATIWRSTNWAIASIYFFVGVMGFQPTLCLRCHIKHASLLRFHSFSVHPQTYNTIFQIIDWHHGIRFTALLHSELHPHNFVNLTGFEPVSPCRSSNRWAIDCRSVSTCLRFRPCYRYIW